MNKIIFTDNDWAKMSAHFIVNCIKDVLEEKNKCSIFLTGGRSASRIYPFLGEKLRNIRGKIDFYIGDERCVAEFHADSNYGMIHKILFPFGLSEGQVLYKMFDVKDDAESAALKYEAVLPEKPDIILLGLGDDGHIASLFPGQSSTEENNRKVINIISVVNGVQRITITKRVIDNAVEIIVLASGKGKWKVLSELPANNDIVVIPARMALRGLWLLDESAGNDNSQCVV